jgi:cytidine deaminase
MPIEIPDLQQLPATSIQLLREAQEVARYAYNLYSKFFVGSAIRCTSGKIYTGTFMENASFGLTVCAEPSALMAANNAGDFSVEQLAVVGGVTLNTGGPIITPCGRCRQMIYEASQVSGKDVEILCANANLSSLILTSISELLPLPFGPLELGLNKEVRSFKKRQHVPKDS